MKFTEVVRKAARKLNLLHPSGRLVGIDSLSIINLIVELEKTTRIRIPTASIREDVFESVDSVAELLEDLTD